MKAKIYDVSKNVKDIVQLEQINLIVTKESGQTVIDGGRILTDSILSKAIQAESILAKHLKANEITGDKIVAGTLEARHLKAESITSELIASEAILAKNIKAENIESKHLKSDSILAKHIKADEIDATKIKANAILAKHIKADEIDGTKIKAQSITVEHLTAGSILLPNENYGGVRINDEGLVSESSTIQTTLNATTGFAIYNKSAKKNIFKVNAENGEVEMNVTRLTISSGNVVKKDELEEIEDTLSLSVKSNENQFYLSTSPIILSGGKWENEAPPWTSGYYMWQRAKITLNNGTIYYSPSENGTCIAGATGAPGINAPTISLSGDSQMIKQDASGNVTPSTSFNITGVAVNTTITRWLFSVNGGAFGTGLPTGVTRSGNVVTVNPKTVTFNTLSVRADDGTVTDTFTIGRAVDGTKGDKGDKGDEGLDGIDAITVVLTNESHTFAGGTTNAIAGSASTEFLAFKGANRASVTIGNITGMPEGMTRTIDINNSQNAKVTFNVTTAMNSRSGIVTIPLTVDGKTINKTFSYSLSLKGDKGDRGEKGATGDRGPVGPTGTSISDVVEWYLATDQSSGVTSPTPENPGNWTTKMQTMTATNKYLWNYEEIKFSNGTSQPTIPVIIGVYGDKGNTGGTGATGRSITAIQEYYLATSASKDVTRPNTDGTNGWTTTMQLTTPTNKYLWNYEKITWSSGTTTTYVEPIIIGVHGDKGDKGEDGADAKLLYLSTSAEAMTFNSDNTPNPATQTITFTANMQNTTGTATFTAIPYNGATAMSAITLGGTGNIRTLTQAQFPATATRIEIKAVLGGMSDTVSVVKLKNGATGGTGATGAKGDTGSTGADGKNAIVGYLTNENITFPANSSGVVTSEKLAMANGVFKVFDGLTEKTGSTSIKYSVVTQTGATGEITNAGAYSVSGISADNASITFRAIYNSSVTIDKVLTLSKSKEGLKGNKGDNAPLVKLSGATQIITQSNTGARTPSASFTVVGTSVNTTISAWTYSVNGGTFGTGLPTGVTISGNTVTITPSSITFNTLSIKATGGGVSDTFTIARIVDGEKGATGATGATGGTGSAGKDAYTVFLSNESHTFQAGTTNAVAGSTTTDIYAYKGTNKVAVTVGAITGMPTGMTGTITNNGTVNAGITFTVATNMTSPSGIVTIPLTVDGKIFNKEFSYALTFKGATGAQGPQGPQGATGSRGPIGATGTSVSSVTEYYLATSEPSGIKSTDTRFTTDMQPMTATNKYLWNYEKINFSNNTSQPTIPVIIGVYGDKGQTGSTGATGRSITSITEHYLATSAKTDVTRSTSGWNTSMQPTTETNKYLWNYETINWSSGTTPTYVEPIIIGVHGEKGDTGADGVSPIVGLLTNESITLPASSTGVVPNSSFTGATGTFNVYEGTVLRNASTSAIYSVVSQSGITVSITQSGVYTVSAMTTGTSVLSGTATLRVVYGGVTVDKILAVTKALAGTNGSTGAPGGKGDTGPAGQNATTYWINASTNAIKKDVSGAITPSAITFSGFSKTGTANPVAYAGRFIIQTSTDGVSYATAYTSSANQSSYTYTIPETASFVKARYYLAGGTSILLDEQTVPVLVDAEGIEVGVRNYFSNVTTKKFTNNQYVLDAYQGTGSFTQFYNLTTPMSNFVDKEVVLSFDIISPNGATPLAVYNTNGSPRYALTSESGIKTPLQANTWTRQEIRFKVKDMGASLSEANSNKIEIYCASQLGVIVKNVKFEIGNVATDWTAAPEDIQAELDDKANNKHVEIIKGDLEKLIGTTEAGIETRVSQKYVETDTFNTISEKVTKMSQSIDGFDFTFDSKSLIDNLDKATGQAEKELQTIRKYIQFTSNGSIILGASDSPSKVEITRDKISFKQNDKEVAWFSNQSFNIESGTILTDLQIGDHKFEKSGTGRTRISYAKKNN